MVQKCQEMVHYGQKCSGNVRRCQEIVMKRSKMVRKWSKIVKNGSGWSEMVQKGSRWSKIPKWSKMLEALNKNTFCIHTAWAPKARKLAAKKGKARPSSQFLWFNLFTVFSSFLVVQNIPYGQVDRLFQMDHGAISPSLMVLFFFCFLSSSDTTQLFNLCHSRIEKASTPHLPFRSDSILSLLL